MVVCSFLELDVLWPLMQDSQPSYKLAPQQLYNLRTFLGSTIGKKIYVEPSNRKNSHAFKGFRYLSVSWAL